MFSELLKKYNLTQSKVALKVGKTQQLVSKWCKGVCEPQIYEITLLSESFKIPINELLDCFKKKED
ncbi:MAG: helix-turn-helix transcriptional regulator [Clostridia bacterium]|nr:helix-turn-helix transcriptional regulator [Clostridia bacterium]